MRTMHLSMIVPIFNQASLIEQCVHSVTLSVASHLKQRVVRSIRLGALILQAVTGTTASVTLTHGSWRDGKWSRRTR